MPTREGTAVLLLAAAIFVLATNLMSGLLFVLDALLVSLLAVGVGTSVLPLRRLRVSREAPARGVEGEPVRIGLTLDGVRGGRFLVVEDGWTGMRGRILVGDAATGAPTQAAVILTPQRRGTHRLGPVVAATRGPIGMLTARRDLPLDGRITIWPRTRPVPPEALALLAPAHEGQAGSGRSRHPHDLYGVRDYQPGDSLARVHWRSSARRGALVVREYERPKAPATTIVLDLDRRQPRARLDAGVRAAASLLRAARDRQCPVTLVASDGDLIEHWAWEAAMDWLAGVEPSGPPLAEVLSLVAGGERALLAVASSASAAPAAAAGAGGIVPILPADEVVGGPTWTGLVYTADGTVQAW